MKLENTYLFVGKQSTELNKLLKKYNNLKEQIADLETTKKAVTEEILNICNKTKGKYQTSTTIFSVAYTKGRVTIKADEVLEKYPIIYKELAKQGDGYYSIKNITPIGTTK